MEQGELENQIKLKIADVIIKLNVLEFRIKKILSRYINSSKNDFIENILLVYNVDIFKYSYIKELPFNITEEVRIAFEECFSKNSTNGKLINPNKNQ